MTRTSHWLGIVAVVWLLAACVVYEPVPVAAPGQGMQDRFERSWSAAEGALADQGLAITTRDRASGTIRGTRGGITVTATVQVQADGSIQVRFAAAGETGQDPGLVNRVSDSYNRRMGR